MLGPAAVSRPELVHMLLDGTAWLAAIAAGWRMRRTWLATAPLPMPGRAYPVYLIVVWLGAVVGAVGLGSANLSLAAPADAGFGLAGRSILGAIAGGILTAELYKKLLGIHGSTGVVFVVPLALGIAIGRVGCFLAGLAELTYGTPTDLPWGVDFGDGVSRHPVQLYESLAMIGFLALLLPRLRRGEPVALRSGFYLFVGWYAVQRFAWEFLKPYPPVLGPLNLFQLTCLAMAVYAAAMLVRAREPRHAPA